MKAIKHMTVREVCDEEIRIERELDIYRRQLTSLDDELNRLHVIQMGWLRRSRIVTRRLIAIATGSDHGVGETGRLTDAYTKMADRYVARTSEALAIYREKDVIYRKQDARYKRKNHVWKRRRVLLTE